MEIAAPGLSISSTRENKRSYSVWNQTCKQWGAGEIDPPALTCQAMSFADAAEKLANQDDYEGFGKFIVRDNETGDYQRIALMPGWFSVQRGEPITLEDLCTP